MKSRPVFVTTRGNIHPTAVYDTYWKFAAKRQEVFYNRMVDETGPWTDDIIIQTHKFTNAYRASDRVSQYLIKHVLYKGSQEPKEILFRALLFKLFNKIETWKLLKKKFGMPTWEEFSLKAYDSYMQSLMDNNIQIYSAAYIAPPSIQLVYNQARKHTNHLHMIKDFIDSGFAEKIHEAPSMEYVFELLKSKKSLGNFLAYQYTIDLNYSNLINFDEMDFVVPGPGARNGIRKCFGDTLGLSETDIIHYVTENQEKEFDRLELNFRSLWGRPLQLIDCQNLFCETDKYSRVAHPEAKGVKHRVKIKQIHKPNSKAIEYWYPPKWNINDKVAAGVW